MKYLLKQVINRVKMLALMILQDVFTMVIIFILMHLNLEVIIIRIKYPLILQQFGIHTNDPDMIAAHVI